MSTLAGVLGASAAPVTFEHKGKTWTVGLLDQKAKTAYEAWLFGRAEKLVFAWKDRLSGEEFATRLDRLNNDYLLGAYDFTGELCIKTLETPSGSLALARILFGATEEEMFALMLERGQEVKAVVKRVIGLSLPQKAHVAAGDDAGGPTAAGPAPNG